MKLLQQVRTTLWEYQHPTVADIVVLLFINFTQEVILVIIDSVCNSLEREISPEHSWCRRYPFEFKALIDLIAY